MLFSFKKKNNNNGPLRVQILSLKRIKGMPVGNNWPILVNNKLPIILN